MNSNASFFRIFLLSLCLHAVPLWAQAQGTTSAASRTADYILAVVNRELVTAGELQLRLDQVREEARRSGVRLPAESELRGQLLDRLIDERVQVTHAREVGQKIDDNELDRAVANMAEQNKLTLPELQERLRAEGMDYKRLRSNIRDQIQVERVRDREVQGRVRITEAEVDVWLGKHPASLESPVIQTRARHILLRPSAQSSQAAALARLEDFKRQIARGAKTFEQLAREHSEDGSATSGGDLAWASPGSFVPEFEEQMNALPLHAVSEPFVSRFGAHLITVLERREMRLDAKQQRERARSALREQKFEAAMIDWARDLRALAYIELRDYPQ